MSTDALIEQLRATRDETLRYYELPESDLARTYGPGKWSVRWVLLHLADSETVLFERIRRVICEPNQTLMVYDQDAWAHQLDYDRVPLDMARRIYDAVRVGHIHYASLFYESKGHIQWMHSATGVRTLKDEFDKVAQHNEHHLGQIRQALGGT
jgi:hypothetical protein